MSEEMKLLTALCEALGFEISTKQTPESMSQEAGIWLLVYISTNQGQ